MAGTSDASDLPMSSSSPLTGDASSGSSVRRSLSPAIANDETRMGTNTGMIRYTANQSTSTLSMRNRTASSPATFAS
jgi:hypothetical protein